GSRLQTRIAAPRPVSGKFAIPPSLLRSSSASPAATARATPPVQATRSSPTPSTAPATTTRSTPAAAIEAPPPLPSTLLAPPVSAPHDRPTTAPTHAAAHIDEATGELVAPMPP